MQDKKLIDIACINNITGVYCYTKEGMSDNKLDKIKYLEIKIVYDGSKTMSMNSNDKYFLDFLTKIKQLYSNEKNRKKFTFLNDFSKEVIERYNILEDQKPVTDHSFYPMNTNNFYVNLMSDYIVQALTIIIKLFYLDKDIKVENFKGNHHRYLATYIVDNKKYFLPFSCIIKDNYNLVFEVNGIKNNGIRFNGQLDIRDYYVRMKWSNKQQDLECKILSDIDNGFIESSIKVNSETILINQEDSLVKEEELKEINEYLKKMNLKTFSRGIKTTTNSYLFYESEIDNNEQVNYAYHVIKKDGIISIISKTVYGDLMYDEELFTPYKQTNYRTNMIKLAENKFLIQHENLDNHMYNYQILDDITKYDVDVSNINNISELKSYKKGAIK